MECGSSQVSAWLLLACYHSVTSNIAPIIRHKDACDATDQVCPVAQFAGHRLVTVQPCSPLCPRVTPTRTRASTVPPWSFSVSSPAGDKGTPPPLAAPTVTKHTGRLATALQRTYPRFCRPQIRAWPRPDKARISNLPSSRTDYISRPLGTLLMNAEPGEGDWPGVADNAGLCCL